MNGAARTEVVTKSQCHKGCVAGSPKPRIWRKNGRGEMEEGRDGSRVPADRLMERGRRNERRGTPRPQTTIRNMFVSVLGSLLDLNQTAECITVSLIYSLYSQRDSVT